MVTSLNGKFVRTIIILQEMSNSALASLTAQYTDSENEDELQGSPDSEDSQASQVLEIAIYFRIYVNNYIL